MRSSSARTRPEVSRRAGGGRPARRPGGRRFGRRSGGRRLAGERGQLAPVDLAVGEPGAVHHHPLGGNPVGLLVGEQPGTEAGAVGRLARRGGDHGDQLRVAVSLHGYDRGIAHLLEGMDRRLHVTQDHEAAVDLDLRVQAAQHGEGPEPSRTPRSPVR